MNKNIEQSPLTETVYYILLSLYTPMHGYAIMQNINKLTNGRVNIGAGTLYGALNTISNKKWIASIENELDSRKKEYIITELGKLVVDNELIRMRELIINGEKVTGGLSENE